MEVQFSRICIIGSGIIGGSIAKRLSKLGVDVIGISNSIPENASMYYSDFIDLKNLDKIPDVDLFILTSPLSTYDFWLSKLGDKIILECGSVKIDLPENIIKTHPIAGSDKSGFAYSDEDLFASRRVIISSNMSQKNIDIARRFWGMFSPSDMINMPDDEHNKIYAYISHFPQLLCFAMRKLLSSEGVLLDDKYNVALRLMNSSPSIWVNKGEIFDCNKRYIKTAIDEFYNKSLQYNNCEDQSIGNFIEKISYLCLKTGDKYQNYAGRGFDDFISIARNNETMKHEYLSKLMIYINEIMDI
jgi:prephenate dehydrogenase